MKNSYERKCSHSLLPTSYSLLPWLLLLLPVVAEAQAKRLVVVKVDGLSYAMIERYGQQIDPRTGKSRLPWIRHLFYERGTRVENFYTRGISLSAPAWSLLASGQHTQIKGNVEFDRYNLHSYDYLNFIPFFVSNARRERVDMPGVEVLDDLGIPMLTDHFTYEEQHATFQLFLRGVRWSSIKRVPLNWAKSQTPGELFSEWLIGMDVREMMRDQFLREVLQKIADPRIRYIDYNTEEFDHITHVMRESQSHLQVLQEIDATIGAIWTAIENSPLAADTVMAVVSDHGTNTDDKIYSQGYNLVALLGSAEGGAHHVVTKRRLLLDYAVKGLNPFTALITTPSPAASYLKGREREFPTAVLDFDGNERASLHLRHQDLNLLQLLLQELGNKKLAPEVRRAARRAFFEVLERQRPVWQRAVAELEEEMVVLRRWIASERASFAAQNRKWTRADTDIGIDKVVTRHQARANLWSEYEAGYSGYLAAMKRLLALNEESFNPAKVKAEEVIPTRSMGDANSIHQLQNYVVGLAPGGLALDRSPDRSNALDWQKSFRRVNYFPLFASRAVRNNVQAGVTNRPIDFIAARLPRAALVAALTAAGMSAEIPEEDGVWLYGGEARQLLLLARRGKGSGGERGELQLRLLPVSALRQEADGSLHFRREPWQAGLPLKLLEAPELAVAADERRRWLDDWHSEIEWLEAAHRTMYSNAVIGLHEHFAHHSLPGRRQPLSAEEKVMRRLRERQRRLVETDFLLLANNHWNFDVRGFNPGGNHGSFFRVSTLATLLLIGGERTGIPAGKAITTPYDSLSFVPTMLRLLGDKKSLDHSPSPPENGASTLPGRLIVELFPRAAQANP